MKNLYTPFIAAGLALAMVACGNAADPEMPIDEETPIAEGACAAVDCGAGTCVETEEVASCECNEGYQGETCNALIPPPEAGMVLWLDAEDPDADGSEPAVGPLYEWHDKSPSALNFLSEEDVAPVSITREDGRHAVTFDGNDDWMLADGFTGLNGTDDYTIVVVGYGGANQNVFLSGASEAGYGLLVETATGKNIRFLHRMPWGNTGGDNHITAASPMSTSELNLIRLERKNDLTSDLTSFVNDAIGETLVGGAVNFDDDMQLAMGRLGKSSATRFLDGQVAELIIYQGVMTPEDAAALDTYLQAKWSVQ